MSDDTPPTRFIVQTQADYDAMPKLNDRWKNTDWVCVAASTISKSGEPIEVHLKWVWVGVGHP